MKVYLVFRYIDYESDDFLGAFDSLEKANADAIQRSDHYDRRLTELETKLDGTIVVKFDYGKFYTTITEVK